MRLLNKRAFILYCMCISLFLLLFTGGTGLAAFADSGTHAKAVIKGGALVLHGFSSGAKSINVASKKTVQMPTYVLPVTVIDARGSGGGWNLTITSTQFSTGGTTPHTLSTSASTINSLPVVVCTSHTTCTFPVNGVSYVHPLTVPSGIKAPAAIKFYSAAARTGLGSFTITPTISILIPANTYAAVYTSIVTVTIVSGP